ncbi:glycosyltransferase family 2 protein [Cryobacterium sp. PH31-L1]|uniref:glycosyltransferase family 2 protein n=1 Tax=Cryobacterium sp. PH31-L1 TaxID=3046199 RepID=UPI0024BA1EE6|nr:glycosyltransferase family 2 protein [Cryobacterium sp. PH31-L1]MDJ0377174.1 glycosyltransferase family 2 protein [Cryobacterium sp. PH31-L1]
MSVSVALCTYDGAAYLAEQLGSILNQSVLPGQIVVSDDGSTDASLAIARRVVSDWLSENPSSALELIVLENPSALGVTANFEQALTVCTGDLIALCDQDDIWLPQRLERMTAEFARRPSLLLLHGEARLVDAVGTPLGLTLLQTLGVSEADRAAVHEGRALDALLRRNIVTGATMMMRRELVAAATPFPAAWVHDEWLAMVAAATGLVDLIDESLTDYRQHGSNQIGVTTLDASGKLGRLRAPRTARNARLLSRAEALQQRASGFEPAASAAVVALFDAKLAHERRRSALSPHRMLRVAPIVGAWRRGDYTRFGLGLQDVLRDLVQPV